MIRKPKLATLVDASSFNPANSRAMFAMRGKISKKNLQALSQYLILTQNPLPQIRLLGSNPNPNPDPQSPIPNPNLNPNPQPHSLSQIPILNPNTQSQSPISIPTSQSRNSNLLTLIRNPNLNHHINQFNVAVT